MHLLLKGGNKKTTKNHKEPLTPGMVRSPAMHEGFRSEDWGTLQRTSTPAHSPEENSLLAAVTSDDSSGEAEGREGSAASPRRHRRVRESPRRKTGGGRSPTQQRYNSAALFQTLQLALTYKGR